MRKGGDMVPKKGAKHRIKESIFGQRWNTAIFDEGHLLRTDGNLGRGAFAIRQRSRFVVVGTATPLFNGERVSYVVTGSKNIS